MANGRKKPAATGKRLPSGVMCRMTYYAHARLKRATQLLQEAVRESPHLYSTLAGRRVTMSDTVVRLTEGVEG